MTDEKSLKKALGEVDIVFMMLHYQNGIKKATTAVGRRLGGMFNLVTNMFFARVEKLTCVSFLKQSR
jgi:hypothetical protein